MTSLAHFIYVAEGFMEDCNMIIRTLTDKYEKVDWQKFCEHWKELQFDVMFYNRLSGAELVELTEECLQCARLYMITDTDNYEEQVIGIFIAYAIAIIQPYKNLCSLRLTPEDVAPLKRVEAIARRDNRTDVLMILGRLYIYSTHYHVSTRERAMDYGIRKYFDDSIRVPKTIFREWHGGLNRSNIKNWEKISAMEKRFMETKNRFKEVANREYPDFNLDLDMSKPIAEEMADSLRKLILGPKKEKEKDEKHGVNYVKMKAVKNVVNPIRHLTGIDERKAAAVTSPLADLPAEIQPKTTLKSVRTKIKENSQNIIVGKELKQYTRSNKKHEPKIKASALNRLPTLDNDIFQEPICITEVDSPEPPFLGFTAEEIERTYASLSNSDLDSSPIKKTKKKRKNSKQLSTSTAKTCQTALEDLNNIQKINGKKLPQSTSKIIKNNQTKTKKRKVSPKIIVKNKKKRGSKLFNESDSDTDHSTIDNNLLEDDCEPKIKEIIETSKDTVKNLVKFKDKEFKADNKAAKDFVQYKINDIVIHADQGLPDLEIELIDQYTGPVNNDETAKTETTVIHADQTLPDLNFKLIDQHTGPDNNDSMEQTGGNTINRDISEHDIPENTNEIEPMDTIDSSEETVEVVRILTESEAAIIETRESLVVPRRKRKRPSLQSKLRKMGILPVANFYNDDVNDS